MTNLDGAVEVENSTAEPHSPEQAVAAYKRRKARAQARIKELTKRNRELKQENQKMADALEEALVLNASLVERLRLINNRKAMNR